MNCKKFRAVAADGYATSDAQQIGNFKHVSRLDIRLRCYEFIISFNESA